MRDEVDEERDVRLHAADAELLQTSLHPPRGILEAQSARRDLHQQGIVEGGNDRTAEGGAGVEPDADATGRAVRGQPAVVRHETVRRVFGRHAGLDREALRQDFRLIPEANVIVGQRPALRDEQLRPHDIPPRDDFRHGMFDLDARVHFDEEELLRIGVVQELDGAGVVDADGPADREGRVENALAHIGREVRRRGDFDDFLMAPLDRTIAFVEVDEIAVAVADELHFDVFGALDKLLEEAIAVAEGLPRFALGLLERVGEFIGRMHDAHPASTAAHRCFHHHGVAEFLGESRRIRGRGHRLVTTRQNRHVRLRGDGPRRDFVAELPEDLRPRAHEGDAGVFAGLGKIGVFTQEPVTGVDPVDADFLRERDDRGDVEISPDRLAGGTDAVRFVGFEPVAGRSGLRASKWRRCGC